MKPGISSSKRLERMTVCSLAVTGGSAARGIIRRAGGESSSKIARGCRQRPGEPREQPAVIAQAPRDQVDDFPVALDPSFHAEQLRGQQFLALPLGDIRP